MSHKGSILAVDDTLASLKLLADILAAEGYQVRPADSGELALASVAANPPELILLDIRMPGMDGFEVLRRLKANAESQGIPVILLSALNEVADKVQGLRLGAVDFVSKPFEPEELLARVQTHLELHRLRARLEQQAAALRKSEEHLRTTLMSVGDGVIVTDGEGRVQLLNAVAEALTGWAQDEAAGRPLDDIFRIVNEETGAVVESPAVKVLREGVIVGLANHTTLIGRDGVERPIADSAAPILIADGAVAGVVLVFRDQTAERAAQKTVRELFARQEAILAAVPDIVMVVDENKVYRWANPAGIEFFGEDVIGKEAACYFEGEQGTYAAVQPLFDGDESTVHVESWQRRRDGEKRLLAWSCRMLKDDRGMVTGALSSGHDITDRRQAEEKAARAGQEWQRTFDSIDSVIWILDREHRILRSNKTAERFFPGSCSGLEGRHCWEVVHGTEAPVPDCPIVRARESLQHETTELQIGANWFEVSVDPILDGEGRYAGAVHIVGDITERRQATEAVRVAHERLQQFVGANIVGVAITAASGLVTEANDYYLNLAGYTRDDLTAGRVDWRAITPPEWLPADEEAIRELRERGKCSPYMKEYLRRDGTRIPILLTNALLPGPEEQAVVFAMDLTERKRAENALRESERRLREAHAMAQLGHWKWDVGTGDVEWSEEVYRIFQLDPAEFTPHINSILALSPWPEDHERDKELISRAIESRVKGEYEQRFLRPDSSVGYYHSTFQGIYDDAGSLTTIIGTIQDITERKMSEAALTASEKRFRMAVEEAPFPIMIHAENGEVLALSRAWKDVSGYDESDLPTTADWTERAYGARKEQVLADIDRLYALDRSKTEGEYTIRCKDGSQRVWEFSSVPLGPLPDGRRMVLSMAADVTERKQTEEFNRRLVASSLDCIKVLDLDANLLSMSEGGQRLLEIGDLRRYLNSSWISFWKPEDQARVCKAVDVARAGGAGRFQAFCPSEAGTPHWWDVIVTPICDANGGVERLLAVSRDITAHMQSQEEKARLEAQLQQSQRMESVGRLAGGVAHDFNNMLAVILGYAEVALGQVGPADPLHVDLEEVQKAAKRAADLTRQLLAFARKQTVAPRVLDLNETVLSMLKMLQRLIGEDIGLAWHPASGLWPVRMDPSQVDQILANLCVNARDAIADVGKITIETANKTCDGHYCADHGDFVPGDYAVLAVSDNGCGMDKETLAHIFEPFFTTKGIGEGTGLGLATVYGAVKQNNGFINAYSEPGQGTTFTIYLPRHAAEAEQARAQNTAPPNPRGSETVLLVEDESAVLKLTTRLLETQGYTVLAAATPGEAARMAQEHEGAIHLLMTDVVMPEMNGRDLARNLMSLHPGLKCLFMSGYTANVIAHHGVLDEGVCFIQKPFSHEALAAKIREALAASDGRDDAPGK